KLAAEGRELRQADGCDPQGSRHRDGWVRQLPGGERRRHRGEHEDRQDRRHAHVRGGRRRPHGRSRPGREQHVRRADHGRQPGADRRGHVRQGPGDEPRLGLVSDPSLQGPSGSHDGRRAAHRPAVDRQRRAAGGGGRSCHCHRVLRRHGGSPLRCADDAGPPPGRAQGRGRRRLAAPPGGRPLPAPGLPSMETISLAGDGLGPDLLPHEDLADCAETVIRRDGRSVLSYGAGSGYTPLRELVGEWFGVHPSRVVLTNGRLHGLALLAQLCLRRGSVIAEYPIHDRAERVFLDAGASLLSVPVDEHGMVVQELQNTLGQYVKPTMVYTTPSFHNPTGWTAGREVREAVVDVVIRQNLVQTEQILLVEDESFALTRFEGEPLPALFDLSGGRSLYSTTFSTTIAPGLRVGFFVLPEGLADAVGTLATDTYVTPVLLAQATVYEFLRRGVLEPHLAHLRTELRARRDA